MMEWRFFSTNDIYSKLWWLFVFLWNLISCDILYFRRRHTQRRKPFWNQVCTHNTWSSFMEYSHHSFYYLHNDLELVLHYLCDFFVCCCVCSYRLQFVRQSVTKVLVLDVTPFQCNYTILVFNLKCTSRPNFILLLLIAYNCFFLKFHFI